MTFKVASVHIATAEWDAMWERLKERFGDYGCHDEWGQGWQYMGSSQKPGEPWKHGFRHRNLPATQERTYWDCEASAGWVPKEIEVYEQSDECPF